MKSRKRRDKISRQQRLRSQLVLDLMLANGLSVQDVAEKTKTQTTTVYKAIEGHTPGYDVIAFLEKKIGKAFTELWFNYPNHSAA